MDPDSTTIPSARQRLRSPTPVRLLLCFGLLALAAGARVASASTEPAGRATSFANVTATSPASAVQHPIELARDAYGSGHKQDRGDPIYGGREKKDAYTLPPERKTNAHAKKNNRNKGDDSYVEQPKMTPEDKVTDRRAAKASRASSGGEGGQGGSGESGGSESGE